MTCGCSQAGLGHVGRDDVAVMVSPPDRYCTTSIKSHYPILRILEEIDGDNAGAIACEREQYWISEILRLGHPLTNVSGNTRPYIRASAGELYRTSQKPNFSRDETQANTAKKLPTMTEDEELLTVEEVAR